MEEFLEGADVARKRGVTPDMVRRDAQAGRLKTAAQTVRGVRLFRLEDVNEYLRLCARRLRRGDAFRE